MFTQDRNQMRLFFQACWRKQQQRLPMEPLEALVADVVAMHPEYHRLLESAQGPLDAEFSAESGQENPFLHMGMHIALREQLAAGRPAEVRDIHQRLTRLRGDAHPAEHEMMECLGRVLWEAQRAGTTPDEQVYFDCLRRLLQPLG